MVSKIFAAVIVFTLPFFVSAQTQVSQALPKNTENTLPTDSPFNTPPPVKPEGTVNCFDYYKFGSVQVDVGSSLAQTVPGATINFSGLIKNDNPYPVVRGAVYAKVFRKQSDSSLAQRNGHFLVDQFFVTQNLNLKAKSNTPISFNWNIPRYTISGDYEIAMFFVSAERFNLLGLTFTDDIVGNIAGFKIQSDMNGTVEFDKNTVKLNNVVHRFAAFPPRFKKDETVKAEVNLVNTTKKTQAIPVSWTLSSWDGLRAANKLAEKTEIVTLAPNETKTLVYETATSKGTVSFLVAKAAYKDTTSLLDIRFVREGIEQVRINFPSILSYPLKQGVSNTLFSCLHSASDTDKAGDNSLALTLKDEQGKTIRSYTYAGNITSAMMGVKDVFTPERDYSTFSLTATLKSEGKVVDEVTMDYRCQDLAPESCPKEEKKGGLSQANQNEATLILMAALIIVLVAGGTLLIFQRKRSNGGNGGTSSLLPLFFALIIVPALFFSFNSTVLAFGSGSSSGSSSSSVLPISLPPEPTPFVIINGGAIGKGVVWNTVHGNISAWPWGGDFVNTPNITITYQAQATSDGQGIADGSNVPMGTVIRFQNLSPVAAWFGTGGFNDSPFGYWRANATSPHPRGCYSEDIIGGGMYGGNRKIFVALSVNPPEVSFEHAGSTATLSCDESGARCTVESAGTIQTMVKYADTYGKFYYGGSDWYSVYTYIPNTYYDTCLTSTGSDVGPFRSGYVPFYGGSYVPIPAQSINFSFNAVSVDNNNPPSAPVVTGPTAGRMNIPYTFTATATDPDGDTLRYGFDWNNDTTVDEWVPASGFVPSGTPQGRAYTWLTEGTYSFSVLAEDVNGLVSPFTPHTITLAYCSPEEGNVCTSSPNSCDMTATGTITCSGACSVTTPPESLCTVCYPDCSRRGQVCVGKTFDDANGCGINNCDGTRSCDYNWKEVAP